MMEGISPDEIRSQWHPIPGYKKIGYHLIFDFKIDGIFTPKASLVANGHESECVPKGDTYSLVVSHDSVFQYAPLNNLEILSCYISNAYLEAPYGEKL